MKKEKFYRRSVLVLFITVLAACGSDNKGGDTPPQVEQLPQTAEQSAQQSLSLNQLAQQRIAQFDLNHQESEMVYEDREVQTTCTREVQTGTRQDCRTEYSNVCHIENQNICRQVAYPVCQDIPENVCRDVPDQVCRNVTTPVCANQTRQVCETTQRCTTETTHICDSRGCRDVPRRVCNPVQSCHNVTENVCHNETHQQCERTTRRECSIVNRRDCHDEYRNECTNVPQQVCQQVPRQTCTNVPVYGNEQYACTQTQHVPVGERVKLHHLAHIKIEFKNPRNRAIPVSDVAVASLEDGNVYLDIDGPNESKYRIIRISQTARRIDNVETVIIASFSIEAL
ncbi:MAG: hypothetical protein JST80_12940 [Bdellovibrionales bacterium]|nr:hypothetical protein [Bdellovibrionales bacterium]